MSRCSVSATGCPGAHDQSITRKVSATRPKRLLVTVTRSPTCSGHSRILPVYWMIIPARLCSTNWRNRLRARALLLVKGSVKEPHSRPPSAATNAALMYGSASDGLVLRSGM